MNAFGQIALSFAARAVLPVCVALGAAAVAFVDSDALLLAPLEARFPASLCLTGPEPTGIIVLGGGLETYVKTRSMGWPPLAGERVSEAVALLRRFRTAKLLYSGGGQPISEAEAAREVIAGLGIGRDRIIVETKSADTAQNAAFSAGLAKPRPGERWLLVTSAYHMPRAVGVFRAASFPVEAYPVDFRTPREGAPDGFQSRLARARMALREYLALVVYRVTGRSRELFPGPDSKGARCRS